MYRFTKQNSSPMRSLTQDFNVMAPTPSKFKTPMSYKPDHAFSPSKQDVWMKELGLDYLQSDGESDDDLDELNSDNETEADQNTRKEHFSDVEFQALQAELERKEKQREELLLQLKARADKINAFKTQLQRAEQAKKGQLKILKKRYDMQLQEKENLVNNLQEFIEEQENSILELEAKICLEERPPRETSVKAVQKLVRSISILQHEKGDLTQRLLSSELRVEILEKESKSKEEQHRKEIRSIEERASVLDKEYEEFRKDVVSPRREKQNLTQEMSIKMEELESEYSELQKLYHDAKEEWTQTLGTRDAQIKSLEEAVHHTKTKWQEAELKFQDTEQKCRVTEKKCRDAEQKCRDTEQKCRDIEQKMTVLAATPPKIQIREVVSNEMKEELEKLKDEYSQLQISFHEQQKDAVEKVSNLKLEINQLQSESKKHELEKLKLQNKCEQVQYDAEKNLSDEKKTLEEIDRKRLELERKLRDKEDEKTKIMEANEEELRNLKSQTKEKIQYAITETEKKYSHFKDTIMALQRLLTQTASVIKSLKKENRCAKKEMTELKKSFAPAMKEATKALVQQVADVNERSKLLTERYRKEMALRKKFHNELVELKGNIRVFCRVRPSINEDGSGPMATTVITYDSEDDGLLFVNNKGTDKQFEFDRVFLPDSTQVEVFNEVSALVTSCIDGYNVCIFAYGQTGSGKTFTMEGIRSNPGINQRALQLLFEETSSRIDWTYVINVSVLEIYNETLRDLLGDDPTAKLDIKQGKEGLFIPGQKQVEVTSIKELNKVFSLGHKNRATASTDMNEHSSRSHALLMITIEGTNSTTGTRTCGKLNLVDLAGSERVSKSGAEGARMKEAQNINRSLSALGDVIHSLKNKSHHIPYRNTKLTYLLQDSLGGDSKTLMVVQVAPVLKNVGETLCSLNFAQRVRQVELGQATRKVEISSDGDSGRPRTPKRK